MNTRLREIENELKNIPVTKDQYHLWKNNPVTRKFMLEVEELLLTAQERKAFGSTIEQIAIAEIKRSEECSVLEDVLAWNPIQDSE